MNVNLQIFYIHFLYSMFMFKGANCVTNTVNQVYTGGGAKIFKNNIKWVN